MSPTNSARHSPSPSFGTPRSILAGRAQIQTHNDHTQPISSTASIDAPHLSITVKVPTKGVSPNEEFPVGIQVVNRANRPVKLALYIDSGQSPFRAQSRATRTDKVLPRVPLTQSHDQTTETIQNDMTEIEAREYFMRETESRKGKPIIALTVESKIG